MSQVMVVYEALLTSEQSLARVQAVRRAIEHVGGKIEIARQPGSAAHVVTIWLPMPYQPDEVLPGLPFYPV